MVNDELLAPCPPTVTENGPELAPVGTTAAIFVSLQLTAIAFVPFSVSVLAPCVAPKPLPLIWTTSPTTPLVGETFEIVGDWANNAPEATNGNSTPMIKSERTAGILATYAFL